MKALWDFRRTDWGREYVTSSVKILCSISPWLALSDICIWCNDLHRTRGFTAQQFSRFEKSKWKFTVAEVPQLWALLGSDQTMNHLINCAIASKGFASLLTYKDYNLPVQQLSAVKKEQD